MNWYNDINGVLQITASILQTYTRTEYVVTDPNTSTANQKEIDIKQLGIHGYHITQAPSAAVPGQSREMWLRCGLTIGT